MVVPAVLLALIGLSCLAPSGLDSSYTLHRRTMATVAMGFILTALEQDWWLLALWAVFCWNALSRPYPAMHLTRLDAIVVFYAVYALVRPYVQPEHLVPVLVGLAALAPVAYVVARLWFHDLHCMGQGQQNHADAVGVVSVAASCGLAWAVSPWWLFAAVPSLSILYWAAKRDGQIGQAVPWLGFVAWVWLLLWSWPVALVVAVIGAAVLGRMAYHLRMDARGVDGGRVRMWWILLLAWWKSGWQARLLGHGWNSWAAWADSFSMLEWKKSGKPLSEYRDHGTFWSHPHSEPVHILFEHGIVGLGLLVGWMGMLAVHALNAAPIQQAVLFPAVGMVAVSLTHFSWTFPAEKHWGHMGLAVISLVLAILLGGAV